MLTKLILATTAIVLGGLTVSSTALADEETNKLKDNSYQEYAIVGCDPNVTRCSVEFPPTTHTTTVVRAVSCFTTVTQGSVVGFQLTAIGGNASFYMPGTIFASYLNPLVTVNASTNLYFNKGQTPVVSATVSHEGIFQGGLNCIITGEHS